MIQKIRNLDSVYYFIWTGEGDQPGARDANQTNRGAGSTLTL